MQKLLVETQLDNDRVRQPTAAHHRHLHQRRHVGTSRKPASLTTTLSDSSQISHFWLFLILRLGKNWMFSNAKTPAHCELMASHLRKPHHYRWGAFQAPPASHLSDQLHPASLVRRRAFIRNCYVTL